MVTGDRAVRWTAVLAESNGHALQDTEETTATEGK